ncbi:MAG: glycosyl transferase, partial [Gammaproteobacteria bacterium]|nr:glycosyl transferase [Gammaproteobacteria bacterium]
VQLDSPRLLLRVVAWFMNRRSALTGICTGDQAIFVRREAFVRLGGYAPIPLMEDIELSRRLRRLGPPARLRTPVVSSARRWEQGGVLRTILQMWRLRLLYWLGVPAERLVQQYKAVR